jgi:O-antigen/teichoic acid export membrane protein
MFWSRLGELMFHRYDNLIVGTISGTRPLGLYNQAYLMGEISHKTLLPVVHYVPLNTYAQLQHDPERMRRAYHLVMFFLARAVPLAGLIFLLLPSELLAVAFGDKWKPAADMLRALSVYAVLLPLFEHARILLVATGAVRSTVRARVAQLTVFLPATVVLVATLGAVGAGISVAVAMIVGTAVIFNLSRETGHFPLSGYLPPLGASLAAALVGVALGGLVEGDLARLVAIGGAIVSVYTLALLLIERAELITNLKLVLSFLRGRTPQATFAE